MKEEIKTCPLCGNKAIVLTFGDDYYCVCENNDCQCCGPFCEKKKDAIKKWNTRVVK